jgi:hypothetical protein
MRTSRFFLTLVAVAAMSQTAAAQDDSSSDDWVSRCRRSYGDSNRSVHCEVRETRISARGTLRVNGEENGGVTVRSHQGRDIIVRARVQTYGRSEDAARQLAGGIRVSTDGTIRATGPSATGRNTGWSVGYEILVPARTNLEVETQNGPISVERVTGTINLRALNGPITLRELAGDVTARATNGPINVTLTGRRWSGEGLDAETVNGPVNVRMPEGYSAHVVSGTVHGPINVPRAIRPERRGRGNNWSPGGTIDANLNGGGPTIRAVTTNGPVSIEEG